jgi:hypothetical protein
MEHPDFENEREWRRYIVDELKTVRNDIHEVRKDVSLLHSVISGLKVTVAMVAGFVSSVVALGIKKLGG